MNFAKLQGAGNDFVLIDARRGTEEDWTSLARAMCHRHFGVGADGLVLLLPSPRADFRMRMFNPDGSEAEACGNGLRCLVKYVVEKGLAANGELTIETLAGMRKARIFPKGKGVCDIQVNMGIPSFRPEDIPVLIDQVASQFPLMIEGEKLLLTFVSMGNPHAVCFLDEPVEDFPLREIGAKVEQHPLFPRRTNFEIANILNQQEIKARVWERGAGETLACGSGAGAIGAAARLQGVAGDNIDIILPGGVLTVEQDAQGQVWLSGPAEIVFTGKWAKKRSRPYENLKAY